MMTIAEFDVVAKIAAPLVAALFTFLLQRWNERKPRIVSYLGHVSAFKLKGQTQTDVFAHSVIVRNTGRKPARDVRVGHNILPENFTVQPPIQYEIVSNPDGARELVFPVLVPSEQVTISYLYFPPLTWQQINSYTKHDEGFARVISVIPTPQYPWYVRWLVGALMFIGASFLIYLLFLTLKDVI
jgi:hypothetical protein